ncbi:MAG: L,D-transpeptidase family protein [Bacteroidales bacterium]|nr:L,D-transpeptidase family protein [Bacteroidales bacterium]
MNFSQTFLENQKSYERVKTAYKEKLSNVEMLLMASNLDLKDLQLFIRIFKQERVLEVWGKKKMDSSFKLVTTYPLCSTSGKPGPKRQQGDEQMPEGVYKISQFNPTSNFYLSMRVDYPNAADLKNCKSGKPGNDIFIHGNCVTIGCFPIGDDAIKELYIMAIEATAQSSQPIPVHIFPTKMTQENMQSLYTLYPEHKLFWENLQPVYHAFENNKKNPLVRITAKGTYEVVK